MTREPQVSRRSFLKTGAAVTGLLAAGHWPRTAVAADPFGGFRVGIQSYSLRAFDAPTALKHTQRLGLRYWEAYPRHLPMTSVPRQVQEYKALLSEHDVTLLAWGVVRLTPNETEARQVFDFAKAIGLVSISADPEKTPETFDLLDKLVEEYDIPVAIHNHGPGHRYDKVDDVLAVVKDRHPYIGACVDTGHYLRSDEDPVEVIQKLGDRVFGVHLKDVKSFPTPEAAAEFEKLGMGKRRGRDTTKIFRILGEGDLDITGCLRALRKLKYDRSVSIEYEENADNPLSDIEVCLSNIRKAVAQL